MKRCHAKQITSLIPVSRWRKDARNYLLGHPESEFDAGFTYSARILDSLDNARFFPACASPWYGTSFGAGAVVLPGVTIGENAMIGAGAVVIEDVPPNTTVVGNKPARMYTRGGQA